MIFTGDTYAFSIALVGGVLVGAFVRRGHNSGSLRLSGFVMSALCCAILSGCRADWGSAELTRWAATGLARVVTAFRTRLPPSSLISLAAILGWQLCHEKLQTARRPTGRRAFKAYSGRVALASEPIQTNHPVRRCITSFRIPISCLAKLHHFHRFVNKAFKHSQLIQLLPDYEHQPSHHSFGAIRLQHVLAKTGFDTRLP